MFNYEEITLKELMELLEKRRQAAEAAEDVDLETEAWSLQKELELQNNDGRYTEADKVTLVTGGEVEDMEGEVMKREGKVPPTGWFRMSHCYVCEPDGRGSLYVLIDNKLYDTSP